MYTDSSSLVQSFLASGSLPLSRSVSQVQAMLARADYNVHDLAEHLRMDPTLAARVMSVANSAYFSRQPCDAIDDAVTRLGTVQLTRIFAQVLANAALIQPLRSYGFPADALWRRSVLAAIGAELAAGRKGEERAAAYMVGLLHLVGMLVIDDLWVKIGVTQKLRMTDFEREWSADEKLLCGFDHAVLGAEMLRQLSFPPSVVGAVARQYDHPFEPVECTLYVGRLVRSCACDSLSIDPNPEVLREFKLSSDSQLEAFIADVRQEAQIMMRAA
jgi:HD-like signal output (HDOD) protein